MPGALRPRKLKRLAALSLLTFYSLLLLLAALPDFLLPRGPARLLKVGSGFLLHELSITPGQELFQGVGESRAVPLMTCFQIIGEGKENVVLYDDLARCKQRRFSALRDPFVIFQMRALSRAMVTVDLGGAPDFNAYDTHALLAFTDYYCHTDRAQAAKVSGIRIFALYLGTDYDDGSVGEIPMSGRRGCWEERWERL